MTRPFPRTSSSPTSRWRRTARRPTLAPFSPRPSVWLPRRIPCACAVWSISCRPAFWRTKKRRRLSARRAIGRLLAFGCWPLAVGFWSLAFGLWLLTLVLTFKEDKTLFMRDFRQYEVWKKAVNIADIVYTLCDGFPKYEFFALGNQLRRAAVPISSNIAEGASRTSTAEFAHYLEVSIGSAFEVETQLLIARRRDYITEEVYNTTVMELQSLERQLNTFISRIRNEQPTARNPKPRSNG